MPDECGYDPDWWKAAKAVSIERKRRVATAGATAKPGDSFLIVTEGEVSEPVYFEFLLQDLQLYSVRVKVIPGDASDPRHVIKTAARVVKDHNLKSRRGQLAVTEPSKFDHVWAIIDTDVAVRQGFWNDVKQLGEARKVKLAHSTPCFEFWLLLHLKDTTRADLVNGDAAKHAVKDELGQEYSTNEEVTRKTMPLFIAHWPAAIRRAERVRQHHLDAATQAPANPSTEVDCLVKDLNYSAPEHTRRALDSNSS